MNCTTVAIAGAGFGTEAAPRRSPVLTSLWVAPRTLLGAVSTVTYPTPGPAPDNIPTPDRVAAPEPVRAD